jgi:predicted ATPase
MMLKEASLLNFKCFDQEASIPFANFTLLTGLNSRGKSTAIQPLLLMAQSVSYRENSTRLFLNGEYVSLGRFSDIRNQGAPRSENVKIGFRFSDLENQLSVNYWLGPDDADDTRATIERLEGSGVFDGVRYDVNLQAQVESTWSTGWSNLLPSSEVPASFIRLAGWNAVHYISADRLGPQDHYLKHSVTDLLTVGPKGQYVGSVLLNARQSVVRREMSLDTGITQTVPDQTAAWLAYLFGEAHLDVQSTDANVILLFLNSEVSPSQLYRPSNVGFGYSFVLPIIVAALVAHPGQIVVVENPEAHLHPAAQSRLIHMLLKLSLSGVQVIIESHSDHVLNALRVGLSEGLATPNELAILYFERREGHYLRSISIDPSGVLDMPEWPEGFFDQTERDFARIFKG